MVLAQEVLEEKVAVGDRVAVIGAEQVGCEVAEFLAERGSRVTLMRRGATIAGDSSPAYRTFVEGWLPEKGVALMPGVTYEEINEEGIAVRDRTGKAVLIQADTIVVAAGSLPEEGLFRSLMGSHPEIHRIGDCVEPRDILAAVYEGYDAACSI